MDPCASPRFACKIEVTLSTATDHWIYNNCCECVCVCLCTWKEAQTFGQLEPKMLWLWCSQPPSAQRLLSVHPRLWWLSQVLFILSNGTKGHWGFCSGSPISLGLEDEEGDICRGRQPKNEIEWLWLSPDFALSLDQRQMVTVSHLARQACG